MAEASNTPPKENTEKDAPKKDAEKTDSKKGKEDTQPKVKVEVPAAKVRELIKNAVDDVELKFGDKTHKVNMKCFAKLKPGTRIHMHDLRYQVIEANKLPIKADSWMKGGSKREKEARKNFNFAPLKDGIPWQSYYLKVLQFKNSFRAGNNVIAKFNGGGMALVIPADFTGNKPLEFV